MTKTYKKITIILSKMSEYLTNLRNHIDAVNGKPFEEKMRRAEMFEELYEYARILEKMIQPTTMELKTN